MSKNDHSDQRRNDVLNALQIQQTRAQGMRQHLEKLEHQIAIAMELAGLGDAPVEAYEEKLEELKGDPEWQFFCQALRQLDRGMS